MIDIDLEAKSIRLDIYCEQEDTVYNIELQNGMYEELPKRSRYYQDLIDVELIDEAVKEVREDEKWRKRIMTVEQLIKDEAKLAHKAGFAEGKKEGIVQGKIEAYNDAGYSIQKIAEELGITIETVKTCLENNED